MNTTMSKLSIAVRKPVIKIVTKPTPVTYIGPGRAKEAGRLLRMLGARKALVITDSFLHQSGLLDGLLESIREADVEYDVFDGVQPTQPSPLWPTPSRPVPAVTRWWR